MRDRGLVGRPSIRLPVQARCSSSNTSLRGYLRLAARQVPEGWRPPPTASLLTNPSPCSTAAALAACCQAGPGLGALVTIPSCPLLWPWPQVRLPASPADCDTRYARRTHHAHPPNDTSLAERAVVVSSVCLCWLSESVGPADREEGRGDGGEGWGTEKEERAEREYRGQAGKGREGGGGGVIHQHASKRMLSSVLQAPSSPGRPPAMTPTKDMCSREFVASNSVWCAQSRYLGRCKVEPAPASCTGRPSTLNL